MRSKIICSLILIQNIFIDWILGDKMCHNLVLKFWVENSCFWKFMESFSCITCHENSFENWFCRKISSFFEKFSFPKFRLIESDFRSIENFQIFQVRPLPNSVGIRSMLDRSKLKIFQFLSIWPIFFFFFASFMFRIHMHCIVFCIYLAVL